MKWLYCQEIAVPRYQAVRVTHQGRPQQPVVLRAQHPSLAAAIEVHSEAASTQAIYIVRMFRLMYRSDSRRENRVRNSANVSSES